MLLYFNSLHYSQANFVHTKRKRAGLSHDLLQIKLLSTITCTNISLTLGILEKYESAVLQPCIWLNVIAYSCVVLEFRECFFLFARSGQIKTLDELTVIMRSLGMSPTIAELKGYLKEKSKLTWKVLLSIWKPPIIFKY